MKLEAKQRLVAADVNQGAEFLRKFFKQHMGKFKPNVEIEKTNTDQAGCFEITFQIGGSPLGIVVYLGQPGRWSQNRTNTALFLGTFHDQDHGTYDMETLIGTNGSCELDSHAVSQLSDAAKHWTAYAEFMSAFSTAMAELLKIAKKNDPKADPWAGDLDGEESSSPFDHRD